MCGIVGILKGDGSYIDKCELDVFTDSLAHRGPDDRGVYIDSDFTLGLGHRRLSIIDLSQTGKQPMSYLDGRFWITYNGEIYNYIELRNELLKLNFNFISISDTEVILAAYLAWGENCTLKFNGMWAFAIWDTQDKKLFLSRDRFSVKPLYYMNRKGNFYFASELKAFVALNWDVRPDLDPGMLLWMGKNASCKNTNLRGVNNLPGGYQLVIDVDNKIEIKQWWKTVEHLVDIPKCYDDQVSQFKELFFNSCKIRMRSDVPIATTLSGGLDSSSIVVALNNILNDRQQGGNSLMEIQYAFICDYIGCGESELKYANDVINWVNIKAQYVNLSYDSINPEDFIQATFYQERIGDPGIGAYLIYKRMRDSGITVTIDGHGGDEELAGYWDYPDIALRDLSLRKSRISDLMQISELLNFSRNPNLGIKTMIKKRLRKLLGQYYFYKMVDVVNMSRNVFNKLKVPSDFALIPKTTPEYIPMDEIQSYDNLNRALYRSFHYRGLNEILHTYDRLSMAHGVECRSPFMDYRLVVYLFSLPSESKLGNMFTKRILRDAMTDLLPESVRLRRDKKGFQSSDKWLGKNLDEFMLDHMSSSEFLQSNIFNGTAIRKEYIDKTIHPKVSFRFLQIMFLIQSFRQLAAH